MKRDKAVLLLIFNRADTIAEVMRVLQRVRPSRLYIAADGPRVARDDERRLCREARSTVLDMINWPCELQTLFRDSNLGCAKAVAEGITWFFDHEEDGIILEDDCLPHHSFFEFCSQMLDQFKDDHEVMHISGFRDVNEDTADASYFFSHYPRIWGWATWRRAWQHFSLQPLLPTRELKEKIIRSCFYGHHNAGNQWFKDFEKSYARLSSWDYQWCLAIWLRQALSVNASTPLVKNIGFDERGTHTTDSQNASDLRALQLTSFTLPVIHPRTRAPHKANDVRAFKRHLDPDLLTRAKLKWRDAVKGMRRNYNL